MKINRRGKWSIDVPVVGEDEVCTLDFEDFGGGDMIIAHGDLDGIISAALVWMRHLSPLDNPEIVFVQPFEVNKVRIPDDIRRIFVVDIAMNNRNPFMTKKFLRKIGNRLERWYDHHKGWPDEILRSYPALIVCDKAESCAELIGGQSELVADATAADTRRGELSEMAKTIDRAIKADLSNDRIRLYALAWLFRTFDKRLEWPSEMVRRPYRKLIKAAQSYALIESETERLAATFQVTGKVALADARNSNHQYDLTRLLLEGQKLNQFAVVLTANTQNKEERITIATQSGVSLVKLFSLESGAPFRVSLPIERLEEALAKLETV